MESENEDLKRRVESVLEMALTTMRPLSMSFIGQGLGDLKAMNGGMEDTKAQEVEVT